jgi:hypothetical protein
MAKHKKKSAARRKPSAGKASASRRRASASARGKKKAGRKAAARPVSRPRPAVESKGRSSLLASLDAGTLGRRHRGGARAGQSGDTQGLPRYEDVDFESVEELVEEGQAFEAGILAGVDDAESESGEVRTREVLEDDVPLEYLEKD